jgi:hypothetical protein
MQSVLHGAPGCLVLAGQRLGAADSCANGLDQDIGLARHPPMNAALQSTVSPNIFTSLIRLKSPSRFSLTRNS